jgi:hypothetical protein
MNLILAIFLYLGLATSAETVITEQDIRIHQQEILSTQSDPEFLEFLEECASDGIIVIDLESGT